MGIVIATLIAIVVGVMIWYRANTALFTASGSHAGHGTTWVALNASWLALNNTANTVWTLFPIVCIVLIAGVVLAIVMGFGRQA